MGKDLSKSNDQSLKGRNSAIYPRRVARQYGICWLKKELSWRLGTLHIFFGNKTFLFVNIESWNFQHLWNLIKFQLIQKHSDNIFSMGCLNELKFCEVSRNPKSNRCWKFQLSILTNKNVLFQKKNEVYQVSRIVLFSTNRWPLDVLTFLIHGFVFIHQ